VMRSHKHQSARACVHPATTTQVKNVTTEGVSALYWQSAVLTCRPDRKAR